MGYYFISAEANDSLKRIHAIRLQDGYCIIRPDRWDRLESAWSNSAESSVVTKATFASSDFASRFLSGVNYGNQFVTLAEARKTYPKELDVEGEKHKYFLTRLEESDVDFRWSDYLAIKFEILDIHAALKCFLSDSSKIGIEFDGRHIRLFVKRPKVLQLFASNSSGETIATISIGDIKDMHFSQKYVSLNSKSDIDHDVTVGVGGYRIGTSRWCYL